MAIIHNPVPPGVAASCQLPQCRLLPASGKGLSRNRVSADGILAPQAKKFSTAVYVYGQQATTTHNAQQLGR